MVKQWQLSSFDSSKATSFAKQLNIHPTVAQLLLQRHIDTPEKAQTFFTPSFDHLHDPFLMPNMDLAVNRVAKAIKSNERILLYGDYDVDGVTSVSLLYSFLKRFSQQLDYYIPDRYKEGYGLTVQGIDYAKQNQIGLLIAMDCGTTAVDSIHLANQYGIDVIVLDHHLPDATLPEAVAIVNAKLPDSTYPFPELSGCGVTFKFAQAMVQHYDMSSRGLSSLLDFVAVSIACDFVPMIGENRTMVQLGLHQINHSTRIGFKALVSKTNYHYPLDVSDLVFGIGPLINAAGRLSDGKEAVRLLLAEDWQVASNYANVLRERNKQRKTFDSKMLVEAQKMWEGREGHEDIPIVILYQPNWHKGVIGIVASRMAQKYQKPAVILCESNGEIVASSRSQSNVDIYHLLTFVDDLLISFGGHPNAAGFALKPENLELFIERLTAKAFDLFQYREAVPLLVEAEIELKDITQNFIEDLRKLAPYGPNNINPMFMCRDVMISGPTKYVKDISLRMFVSKDSSKVLEAVGFRRGDYIFSVNSYSFHLCFKILESVWRGKKKVQLQIKDISENELPLISKKEVSEIPGL